MRNRRLVSPSCPTQTLFDNLVVSLLAQNRIQRALDVLPLITRSGIRLSERTRARLQSDIARAGLLTDAVAVFDGLAADGEHVDGHTFANVVAACGRASDMTTVRLLYQFAVSSMLIVNAPVVDSLIEAFERNGDLHTAEHVFRCHCIVAVPNVSTLTAMLGSCINNGLLLDAVDTLNRFSDALSVPLDLRVAMISVFAGADRVPDAMDAFRQLVRENVDIDASVLTALFDACQRVGYASALDVLHQYATDKALPLDEHVVSEFCFTFDNSCKER
ncbi:Pentacotripeptide-repeat region of PRORP domain-containing protein [Plasmodiophora brassicae]|nr:hypothetical protein PBRA_005829 [Plasmodiophora brassicae]